MQNQPLNPPPQSQSWPWPAPTQPITINHIVTVKFEGATGSLQLQKIKTLLQALGQKVETLATEFEAAMERVALEVTESDDAVENIITLLESVSRQIVEFKDAPAKLVQLAEALNRKQQRIAEAILAHTPADPNAPGEDPKPEEPPVDPPSGPQASRRR